MKRIYTRTGDKGSTGLHGGVRVPKTHPRIEANGVLDELNTDIGVLRAFMPKEHPCMEWLKGVQMNLMTVMSLVATPIEEIEKNPNRLPEDLVEEVEMMIDRLTAEAGPSEWFMLPGGTPVAALMHIARVSARRAERQLWAMNATDPVPEVIPMYINRLSDLFFTMARAEMAREGVDEERWKEFAYKRKPRP